MRHYKINANLIQGTENFYEKATSAYETGSEPQSELDKGVYSHRLFSTSFLRELWLTH